MDTKTFLERVTAPQDSLVVATLRGGIFWNRGSFADAAAAAQSIARWDADPETTVYFSVGRFAGHETVDPQTGKRKLHRRAEQATWFKALAVDIDCGPDKPYADQKDGWRAFRAAYEAIGLPQPMVISSGNGIHAYWPMTVSMQTPTWIKASVALRMALADNGVEIDTGKVHDPSMVLRPVGTMHKKQLPHKPVVCKMDCPDYDPAVLATALRPWFARANMFQAAVVTSRPGRAPSAVTAAILGSGDIVLDTVAKKCMQLAALVSTGGIADAAGQPVEEPLWRASLGFAKYCNNQQEAVTKLAGQHPDFDLQQNMAKMSAWHGTGPTTCAKFEQLCGAGCNGCKYKGTITSPAQLSGAEFIAAEQDSGEIVEVELPKGYLVDRFRIWREIDKEVETTNASGNTVMTTVKDRELVSNYLLYVTGVYADAEYSEATARVACRYPLGMWKEFDLPLSRLAAAGKEFGEFLMNKMIYVPTAPAQIALRTYLMRYLEMVQAQTPAGGDFTQFGWQADGAFLCGDHLLGSPDGATSRRLKGPAARYKPMMVQVGERDEWVKAMAMLDAPEARTIASAVLVACTGVLGRAAGNSSFLFSIYSPHTTTGKTLSLLAANSLCGNPRNLLMAVTDTANAIYKIRGTLNHLPGTIDELTTLDPAQAVDLAYNLSSGREKLAMTRDREVREPVTWDGPTLVTCNYSLHAKFEEVMSQNDPVRARTLEVTQHDNTFVRAHGTAFHTLIRDNYGWALPELVEAVLAAGGERAVWDKGSAAFDRRFGFAFEPAERFYRTAVVSAWIMGTIGKRLGLFPMDVDAVAVHLLKVIEDARDRATRGQQDAFDIVGQFLQEHNDQLIECREEYDPNGNGVEKVQYPVPERAVARLKVVHDSKNPVLPGSVLMINVVTFKKWLLRTRDNVQRVCDELDAQGALIHERERVTLYKGCSRSNPGQAFCVVVNINHPRFHAALSGAKARQASPVTLAVLHGGAN